MGYQSLQLLLLDCALFLSASIILFVVAVSSSDKQHWHLNPVKLEFERYFEVLFSNTLTTMMNYRVVGKNKGFVVIQTWAQIQTVIYDSCDLG